MSAAAPRSRTLELGADFDPESAGPARIHAYAYTGSGCHAIAVDDAVAFVRDPAAPVTWAREAPPLVWIDVESPRDTEEAFLRDALGLHPLAVEDSVRGRQRPKLDRYPDYYFLVMYAARLNTERHRMALNELHLFIGRHFLITVHDHRVPEFIEVLARWRADAGRYRTVGALVHGIMDTVVDDYFPMLDHFAERVELAEADVFEGNTGGMQSILSIRRELTLFRKVVGPERETMATLLRRDLPFLSPELLPYFQDVYDHLIRVVEEIDTLRDLLSVAMEGQISIASNELNVTMRVMAAWSIILMAMAVIAGIYGMNFVHMPELQWQYGYPLAVLSMLAIGGLLFLFFRRRNWV